MQRNLRQMWHLNKYTWMSLAFGLLYLMVAPAQHLLVAPVRAAWALLGLGLIDVVCRTLLAYRRGGVLSGSWSTFFNGLEILLISAAIGVTGGIRSDLWLLFFVVLIFESLYAAAREQRLLEFYICMMYLAATLPHQFLAKLAEPTPVFVRQYATHAFFLMLVSSLARRISADAKERDRQLLLLREQMAAGEERARIAREVHDSLGHALVSAILRLELCARLMRREPAEAETMLKEEIVAIRAAWNEGRDLAFHLLPWNVGAESLPAALGQHIARFAERTGVTASLQVSGEVRTVEPAVAFGVVRIVQEALTNAAKHAGAAEIEVTLSWTREHIVCAVRDNGAGFDTDATRSSVGLQSMQERAERLGGSLHIESAPGQGALISMTLPIS